MTADRSAAPSAAERIRRAAIEVFAEAGYGGSSTREIAKRLNMSATAMYPHYASKEELLYAIALDGHSSLLRALKAANDAADAAAVNNAERLKAVVAVFATWLAENRKQARVVHYELHGLTPAHHRAITALRRQTNTLLADLVTVRRRVPVVSLATAQGSRQTRRRVRRHRRTIGALKHASVAVGCGGNPVEAVGDPGHASLAVDEGRQQ